MLRFLRKGTRAHAHFNLFLNVSSNLFQTQRIKLLIWHVFAFAGYLGNAGPATPHANDPSSELVRHDNAELGRIAAGVPERHPGLFKGEP